MPAITFDQSYTCLTTDLDCTGTVSGNDLTARAKAINENHINLYNRGRAIIATHETLHAGNIMEFENSSNLTSSEAERLNFERIGLTNWGYSRYIFFENPGFNNVAWKARFALHARDTLGSTDYGSYLRIRYYSESGAFTTLLERNTDSTNYVDEEGNALGTTVTAGTYYTLAETNVINTPTPGTASIDYLKITIGTGYWGANWNNLDTDEDFEFQNRLSSSYKFQQFYGLHSFAAHHYGTV